MVVPNIYHFGGLRSVLPMGVLQCIDYQPGNFESNHGRAIGGIVDVKLKTLRPKRFGGYVELNLLDASFYVEAPIGDKASVAVAGRRSYIDALIGAGGQDSSGVNLVNPPRYYDFQLLANYRPAPAHNLRLIVFGSDDQLSIVFANPGLLATQVGSNRFDQHVGFNRAQALYDFVPSERLDNRLTLSVGNDIQKFNLGSVVLDLTTETIQLRDTFRWKANRWLTAVAGLDALTQRWSGIARLPAIPREGVPMGNEAIAPTMETRLDDVWMHSPAVYAQAELRPMSPLYLSTGVRVDYFSRISQTTASPRLVARYDLRPWLTIKGGAGLYYQEPQVEETDLLAVTDDPHDAVLSLGGYQPSRANQRASTSMLVPGSSIIRTGGRTIPGRRRRIASWVSTVGVRSRCGRFEM